MNPWVIGIAAGAAGLLSGKVLRSRPGGYDLRYGHRRARGHSDCLQLQRCGTRGPRRSAPGGRYSRQRTPFTSARFSLSHAPRTPPPPRYWRGGCCSASASMPWGIPGSQTSNVLPTPTLLVAVSVPPCASTKTAGDVQTQSQTGSALLLRRAPAEVAVEEMGQLVGRNPRALVAHGYERPAALCRDLNTDGRVLARILRGVVNEVREDLVEVDRVRPDNRRAVRLERQPDGRPRSPPASPAGSGLPPLR